METGISVSDLRLDGGHLALDFVNSVGGPGGLEPDPAFEALHDYGDLLDWSRFAGGLDGGRSAAAAPRRPRPGCGRAGVRGCPRAAGPQLSGVPVARGGRVAGRRSSARASARDSTPLGGEATAAGREADRGRRGRRPGQRSRRPARSFAAAQLDRSEPRPAGAAGGGGRHGERARATGRTRPRGARAPRSGSPTPSRARRAAPRSARTSEHESFARTRVEAGRRRTGLGRKRSLARAGRAPLPPPGRRSARSTRTPAPPTTRRRWSPRRHAWRRRETHSDLERKMIASGGAVLSARLVIARCRCFEARLDGGPVARLPPAMRVRGAIALAALFWAALGGTAQAKDLVVRSFDGTPIVAHWFPSPWSGGGRARPRGAERSRLELARREGSVARSDQAPARAGLQRAHLGPARLRRLRRRGHHRRAAGRGPRRQGPDHAHGPSARGPPRPPRRPARGHDRRQLRRRHPVLGREHRPPHRRHRPRHRLELARDQPLQGPHLQAGLERPALPRRPPRRRARRPGRRARRGADRRARPPHHLRVRERHEHRSVERRGCALVPRPRPRRQGHPPHHRAHHDRRRHRGHALSFGRGRAQLPAAEGARGRR